MALWTPPKVENWKAANRFDVEAIRIMACFPEGTTLTNIKDKDLTVVMLPNGVALDVHNYLLTQRMANNLSKLEQMLWNEFVERALDAPMGTTMSMDWLMEVTSERTGRGAGRKNQDAAPEGDAIDAIDMEREALG